MDLGFLLSALVTLFVVIDPIGMAPLFVALTQGMTGARRRAIALRACLIAFGLLTLFGVAGEAVLAFVGISMPAFQIAGGLLLFLTALDMLFERRTQRRQEKTQGDEAHPDPSVFPLAIPLIAGPGAIASMILMAGQAPATLTWGQSLAHLALLHGAMIAVLALVLLLFLAADLLERALGHTGILVVTRLLGMLLAALSIQFVLDGMAGAGLIATTSTSG
ncbi:MAG: MarC family protein [Pseudomonadota bacterium]